MVSEHVYSVLLVSPYIAKLWITSTPEVVNKLHPLGFHLVLGINSLLGHCHDFLQLEILVLLQEVRVFFGKPSSLSFWYESNILSYSRIF